MIVLATGGNSDVGRMTRLAAGRLKAIVSTPARLLDLVIASRREPAPASAAVVTVKTVSRRRSSRGSRWHGRDRDWDRWRRNVFILDALRKVDLSTGMLGSVS